MKVLVLNSGSSSQKTALFELDGKSRPDPVSPLWGSKIEWDGDKEEITVRKGRGEKQDRKRSAPTERGESAKEVLCSLWEGPVRALSGPEEINVIGHRIVHGGPKLAEPVLIDAQVKQTIADVSEIAPLHNHLGLQGIEIAERLFPGKAQVAVFDTGFHRTLPLQASVYPGSYEWFEQGIRRYGFHGINHQYCAQRAAQLLGREPSSLKIVSCHLGNGCSLCAIDDGKSIDTTMGFTPLEGLMMGSRSGSVDPGILIHLWRTQNADARQLDELLNRKSGLLGISGVSSDMRDVMKAAGKGSKRAKLAFDIFVHRLQSGIAAMAASLSGINALVFTAGIGENSPEVRRETCAKLAFLGIHLDEARNSSATPDVDVSTEDSPVRILVIRAQEDWAIARECVRLTA